MIISINSTYVGTASIIIIIIIGMIRILLSGCINDYNAREREEFGFGAIFLSNYFCCYFAGFEIRSVYGYNVHYTHA